MTPSAGVEIREIRHWHGFCGSGGGGIGFNRGSARVGNMQARFRCIGGVDSDAHAIRDFSRLVGVKGTVLDLFDREQYRAVHGKEPPASWREATAEDIRRSANGERPHIVFLSAPCKGFSGLLSPTLARTAKYQAMNRLTLRGIKLILEAWEDDPPELIIFENVPKIATVGRPLLDEIVHELEMGNYAHAETTHDCGVLGGLAQHRKRFLLVARHRAKVRPHLWEPPRQRVRAVGEVIASLPMPDDPRGGPMHRLPRLEMKTWTRLALIPAGGDWRSLQGLDFARYGILPVANYQTGVLGVTPWDAAVVTISGRGGPTNGAFSLADPRLPAGAQRTNDVYRVVHFNAPAGAITSGHGPSSGGQNVADPRTWGGGRQGVLDWAAPAGVIAGESHPSNGPYCIADPRPGEDRGGYHNYGVCGWLATSETVTSQAEVGAGRFSVADPRPWLEERPAFMGGGHYGVNGWYEPAPTVTGSMSHDNGRASVADPREVPAYSNLCRVEGWDDTAHTVVAAVRPAGGALSVADPRGWFHGAYLVRGWDVPTGAVTSGSSPSTGGSSVADPRETWGAGALDGGGSLGVLTMDEPIGPIAGRSYPSNGAYSVADGREIAALPRMGEHSGKLRVEDWGEAAHTVTTSDRVGSGAPSVADPRIEARGNAYGVLEWEGASGTIIGYRAPGQGACSIADPRVPIQLGIGAFLNVRPLPADDERPDPPPRIISLDNTWHRPFTTLELAALQSYPVDELMAEPLSGTADTMHREHIGNSVPPDSAAAIASTMGKTLLMAWSGTTFVLSSERIWVQPLQIALSIAQPGELA